MPGEQRVQRRHRHLQRRSAGRPAGPGSWARQPDLANWAGAPIKGKAGKVSLAKVAAADAPAFCQAAAQGAGAAAFSIAATPQGAPKLCFLFASRPAKQCGPGDRKLACKLGSLGSFVHEP
jgi:hypothetical protein